MKKLLISLALAIGCIAGPPMAMPSAAPRASASAMYYVYRNGYIYTYLYEWPGLWILINVQPA